MIDHLGINCTDLERAAAFYDRVLGVLGHRRVMDVGVAIGYGTEGPDFWISTFDGVGPNREVHVAFTAPDAATVRAWQCWGPASASRGSDSGLLRRFPNNP